MIRQIACLIGGTCRRGRASAHASSLNSLKYRDFPSLGGLGTGPANASAAPKGQVSLASPETSSDEKNRGYHQALQTRRGEGSAARGGPARNNRDRGERLWPPEGTYGALSRRRVRSGFPPEGKNRDCARR